MDYEKDIKIDESALDVEWLNQAALAVKYGKHLAECKDELARAEEGVKLQRAKIIQELTESSDKMLTGVLIEAHYRTHKKHIKAKHRWLDAKTAVDIAEIVQKEISLTRKAALQNLVTLHGQHYFAGPNVPRELTQEVIKAEQQKKSNQGVASKMNRKNK